MESIWRKTTQLDGFEKLDKNIKCNTVVIGGGIAGILIAYKLKKANIDVVLVEAKSIGSGQTENTSAKITSQHNLIYDYLINKFDFSTTKKYLDVNEKAIDEIESIVSELKIDCDFKRCSSYLYSTMDVQRLKKEYIALQNLGFDAVFHNDIDLPFEVKSALEFKNQASFNPLNFIKGVAREFKVYENTLVTDVVANKVICDNYEIECDNVVFATHFPFINKVGHFFMKMHQERSYIIQVANQKNKNDMYLGIDEDYLSFRYVANQLLLGGSKHRCGENNGDSYEKLIKKGEGVIDNFSCVAKYSAQDCMTIDKIPYIGRVNDKYPNYYVATGFNKWGMTSAMVAGMIISDQILGIANDYACVFSCNRINLSASLSNIIDDTMHSIKGIAIDNLIIPNDKLSSLKNNESMIILYEFNKYGVYQDSDGKRHFVSVRCPHLGCELKFNYDDLTWDCPCHGSRFDFHGNLLDNPSITNIKK